MQFSPKAPSSSKVPALTVLMGGGFDFEMNCLLPKLDDYFEFHVLRTVDGMDLAKLGLSAASSHMVPKFATVTRPSRLQTVRAFAATFTQAFKSIRRPRIEVVFGVGCSHLVPMFAAARMMGCKTVFLETITRADQISATGRLVYRARLADTFIIQWPELQVSYPGTVLGSIL